MCGIVGYVGSRSAPEFLIQGLRRLEYRGYDSAGIALFVGNEILIEKSQGRLENLEKILQTKKEKYREVTCGMGHTRWATHGKPTTQNAHPHKTGHVVLVHNGIIENYLEIKRDLCARGHMPQSETDSELFGFLVLDEMEKGLSLVEAVRKSFVGLRGQCSLVVASEKEPGVLVGVRNGSPLVVARDLNGGVAIASDSQPLLEVNREVIFLEHGDVVVATHDSLEFFDLTTGEKRIRKAVLLDWSLEKMDKGGFQHYMLKEIHEQPQVLVDTLNSILDRTHSDPFVLADQPGVNVLEEANELTFVACGTSWHAALLGRYWIERWARVPVNVELASEFRYRQPVIRPGTVVIGVSQSGETADTLAVIREMKNQGVKTLGITNVRGSTLSREADGVFYTSAGPEIGVAATKTFMAQLLVMLILAGNLALHRHKDKRKELTQLFGDLLKLPHLLNEELQEGSLIVAKVQATLLALGDQVKGFFFIGRGYSFPMALEGALKLKEISYDYSEGYAAGELKHGPIAMIDQGMVVVVLAPSDLWRDKTVSNLEEVKARGATILGVGDPGDQDLYSLCDYWIPLTQSKTSLDSDLLPFLLTPIVQLLSYYRALMKKTDVDKPRNLAKSVTVE